jgi:hypothetical protein
MTLIITENINPADQEELLAGLRNTICAFWTRLSSASWAFIHAMTLARCAAD